MTTKFTNNAFATLSSGITNSTNTIQLTAGQGTRFPTVNSAAVTVTIATPAVVTWTAHGLLPNQAVIFSTTGALPTGITAGTVYYVVGSSITSNTFQVSASVNGAAVATTGSQSGVHTGSSDWFWATLTNASNVLEIVRVVARATDTITAFRGQDNSTANAYLANDRLELRPTAGAMNDKLDINQANYAFAPLASPALTGVPTAPTAAATNNSIQLATTAFVTTVATQNPLKTFTDTGAANAYVVTPNPAWASYVTGADLYVKIGAGNTNTTGVPAINVSALGSKNILNEDGSTPEANTLIAGQLYHLVYDGTQFEIIGTKASGVQGASIASAATVNLDTSTGDYVHITGTTTITAITLAQGRVRTVVFDGVLTLTNGASLILPSGANIITAAGDTAILRGEAAGVVRCIAYVPASGKAVVNKQPTRQTFASGSGTYTTPAGAVRLFARVVGGGAGGGAASNGGTNGGAGGASTFGTLTANGGGSGVGASGAGGAGGTASGGDINLTGSTGGTGLAIANVPGGSGGGSAMGAGGGGGAAGGGAGGGGGGANSGGFNGSGGGGGGGGYTEKLIIAPAATYAYSVGGGGAAGTGGNGGAAGAGAAGVVIVDEYYA